MPELSQLNKSQREAAVHKDGPLLVVAGAGTGKTTVLINRLVYLISQGQSRLENILLLTFTEKAAGEMEDRALKALPYGAIDPWIHTFHGFCERLLRQHALDIGLPGDFRVLAQTDQWVLIKKHLDEFELDYYRPLGNPNKFIIELIKHFSRLKDEEIGSKEYLDYADELRQDQDDMLGGRDKSETINSKLETNHKSQNTNSKPRKVREADHGAGASQEEEMEAARIIELANAYHKYNQLLLDNGYLDFGDLIRFTIRLFRERPNILAKYQEQFHYIMVDEFQDTNWAQYELLKFLAGKKANITVVGDDDQCLPGSSIIQTQDGEKKIKDINKGDRVMTAVGKGHASFKPVKHVQKTEKESRMITFDLRSGHKISVTDNHKMFCFVPVNKHHHKRYRTRDGDYYYVYLMYKQGLGWRLGITNDLATRLRLERSADKILAIDSLASEEEARYAEIYYSLKYSIPTVCFQERGGVLDKKKWSEKLYSELNVQEGVERLAEDKGVDLRYHQVSLDAVNRGGKRRIKINLEMCSRSYRSKYAKQGRLVNPNVSHLLWLETSDERTIGILEHNGFNLTKAKKGKRLRVQSQDLDYLGKEANRLEVLTGGIVEVYMKVAKTNVAHKRALVIPASNIIEGMFLPVMKKNGLEYEQVVKRGEKEKKQIVYDLEIADTHNFIADGIAVHNSVYKFRGASLSNIMQFKDDYPEAREVVLTDNYRSGQRILDAAYEFIQRNNPNRLEEKLSIKKRLSSQVKIPGEIVFHNFPAEGDQTAWISSEILRLKQENPEAGWKDFAVLVRANSAADKFIAEFKKQAIPHIFVSLKGLYYKPIIMDILAYFRLLDNYHDSASLFRVLNMEVFKVSHEDVIALSRFARQKNWSLFQVMKSAEAVSDISPEGLQNIRHLLVVLEKHSRLAREVLPSRLYVRLVWDAGLNLRDHNTHQEYYSLLNQFYRKIQDFEKAQGDARLRDLVELIDLELEAGETGQLKLEYEDEDVVRIMTVHAAKGLEFPYVFMPDLVDKRFPTIARSEKISIPDVLVREKLPEGKDVHIEEERRLFYVAVTRAKDSLYLTSASDYGGARAKKPSFFIRELGFDPESRNLAESKAGKSRNNDLLKDLERFASPATQSGGFGFAVPKVFSYSQLEAYLNCPLQYKFNFILKIPIETKPTMVFGRVMHSTLYEFMSRIMPAATSQADLFSGQAEDKPKPDLKELLKIYDEYWQNDGYISAKQRDEYKKQGKKMLEIFYQQLEQEGWPDIRELERNFKVPINGNLFRGAIDRIDNLPDGGVELIDYKTGSSKDKLDYSSKRQLVLYRVVAEQGLGLKVSGLSFYYLESGRKLTFQARDKDVDKLKEEIGEVVAGIKQGKFPPNAGRLCNFCDFNSICEFAQRS
jgi:DNA helicase-2/ATP-dependent DNA helicase PcrA